MILLLSCYAAYFNRIWHYSVCFTLVSEHWKSMHAISYCYISQLLYASPAWWGYLKADERNRLQSVIKKTIRYRYLPRSFSTLDELREDSNEKLFSYPGTTQTMFCTASCPNLKSSVITFVNEHTI